MECVLFPHIKKNTSVPVSSSGKRGALSLLKKKQRAQDIDQNRTKIFKQQLIQDGKLHHCIAFDRQQLQPLTTILRREIEVFLQSQTLDIQNWSKQPTKNILMYGRMQQLLLNNRMIQSRLSHFHEHKFEQTFPDLLNLIRNCSFDIGSTYNIVLTLLPKYDLGKFC